MTDVQICNLALARLGDARITSLSDATAQAQYCSLFYSQTLEELQTEFDWQFCRKLSSLTADPTPPAFGYSHRFEVPADFLRLIRLNGIDEDENFSKWEIVDGFIHTDLSSPAQIEYIANVTDASKFPAVFIEIFSAKLAVNLALPLTASKELFAQMAEIFTANIQRPIVKALILANAKSRPSTTLTEDELCRQAILRLGTAEQFGSSSQAMLLAQSLYPQVRDSILLTGSWTWATKATTLTEDLIKPEYKWGHRYALPTDCLRVFRVDEYDSSEEKAWEIAGSYLLTDADSGSPAWLAARQYVVGNAVSHNGAVYRCLVAGTAMDPGVTAGWTSDWEVWLGKAVTIDYIFRETDVTKYDNLFIDLLTTTLAAKLAVPLTGDAQKAQLLTSEVENLFKNPAMRRDSTERRGRIKPAWTRSKLVSSRSGGDGITKTKGGGGPAGGVSYPALLIQVGDVESVPQGTQPTVTNTGTAGTAVLNFKLPEGQPGAPGPEGPIGPANVLNIGTVNEGAAGATITGTSPSQTLNLTIPKGDKGDTATIAVGNVNTVAPSSPASVTNTGTAEDAVLDFEIPQGYAGTITVGTVTTGAEGNPASVTNVGTPEAAIFDIVIPKGDTGVAGPSGAFYSPTPPFPVSDGTLWWKTDTKQLFLYTNTKWAEVNARNDEFPVFDVDALNYIAAVEAADASVGYTDGLEQAVKDALTMFVVNAKLDGIWDALKASCIMAGARSLEGALVPLAGVAPTNVNFTATDYDRKTGLKADVAGKRLDSNLLNDASTQNNLHLSLFTTELPAATGGKYAIGSAHYAGVATSGHYMSAIQPHYTTTTYLARNAFDTGNPTSAYTFAEPNATGFYGASRGNPTSFKAKSPSFAAVTSTATSAPLLDPKTHWVFHTNSTTNLSTAYQYRGRLSFFSIGDDVDLDILSNRVTNLMSQLNSAIP
jgi:hypothetical protein